MNPLQAAAPLLSSIETLRETEVLVNRLNESGVTITNIEDPSDAAYWIAEQGTNVLCSGRDKTLVARNAARIMGLPQ